MTNVATQPASSTLIWSGILGLTAVLGSYGLACVFPFAAFAALAAITLPHRQGIALMAAAWTVNQIVGFTLMSYPHDAQAVAWGLIIGAGAIAAFVAARLVFGRETRLLSLATLAALAASIIAYQSVMFAGAFALDGFESSTLEIVATVARNDAFWFAGLAALRLALEYGLPRWFGSGRRQATA